MTYFEFIRKQSELIAKANMCSAEGKIYEGLKLLHEYDFLLLSYVNGKLELHLSEDNK